MRASLYIWGKWNSKKYHYEVEELKDKTVLIWKAPINALHDKSAVAIYASKKDFERDMKR